jgi:hypothetical protein
VGAGGLVALTVVVAAGDTLGLPPWAQGSIALVFLALVLSGRVVVLRGPYDREAARADRWETLFVDKFSPTLEANTSALRAAMEVLTLQREELNAERARREALEAIARQRGLG